VRKNSCGKGGQKEERLNLICLGKRKYGRRLIQPEREKKKGRGGRKERREEKRKRENPSASIKGKGECANYRSQRAPQLRRRERKVSHLIERGSYVVLAVERNRLEIC